jgi:CBS domain-containing protein
MIPKNYSYQKVKEVVEYDFITLPIDSLVAEVAKIMRDKDVSSVVITRKGAQKEPVGILTERDIVRRVMAENKGPFKVTAGSVMSSPLITIDPESSIKDAITLMRSKKIRRLPVVDELGEIVGIVTLKSAVGNMPSHSVDLLEIESSRATVERGAICPYCQLMVKGTASQMSRHVDSAHSKE